MGSLLQLQRYGQLRIAKGRNRCYYSCSATVSSESPKEETDAGLIVDDSKIDFTIRFCQKAAAVTSTGYRVLFRDVPYDILGVDHMNYKRKAVKLLCQKASRS